MTKHERRNTSLGRVVVGPYQGSGAFIASDGDRADRHRDRIDG
jgi:hypothetical protein